MLGVGVGLLIGLRTRKARPFLISITIGTFVDCFIGFFGPCRPLINDYNAAEKQYKLDLQEFNQKNPPPK